MLWLPGQFRPLLHAVPDAGDYTHFRSSIIFWGACGAPATWISEDRLPPYPVCPDCEDPVGTIHSTGPLFEPVPERRGEPPT